jgi:hypothetical protein
MNTMLKFDLPANQSQVTETIVEFLRKSSDLLLLMIARGLQERGCEETPTNIKEVNAALPSQVMGPTQNISGTYPISTKLCWPATTSSPSNTTIQLLTHGVGFDKSYWDFYSPSYSYQDAAARAGYTTLPTTVSASESQTIQIQSRSFRHRSKSRSRTNSSRACAMEATSAQPPSRK